MDDITRLDRCVRCGAALGSGAAGELCPRCARESGDAPTRLDAPAPDATHVAPGAAAGEAATVLAGPAAAARHAPAPHLEPGQAFGPYHIIRMLGRGGMGEVHEAEHVEHGRRVALKILGRRLTGREDRERFLREGELAASINHPHAVYVYGSDEIDGAPVIAMELLPGGTLRDLVAAEGPLPPPRAVDLILDVIAGLSAAHAAGILHRDIKPANCFVDRDGVVKVGDFGLSIATTGQAASSGLFQGTPQFAPPEQLRGEPLDVRADIYSVGATLFHLLTGQPPFDDPDMTTLVTRVTGEPARSPRALRAGVPDALARVATRCLAKDRADRPASYAELEDALRRFGSAAPVPAPLGRRFLAGAVDQLAYAAVVAPAMMFLSFQGLSDEQRLGLTVAGVGFWVVYFGLLEGLWAMSLGKRALGLRVVRPDGEPPGLARAFARAGVYELPAVAALAPSFAYGAAEIARLSAERPAVSVALSLGFYAGLALLFVTARQRNGLAAVHDLVTGTRVVRRVARARRAPSEVGATPVGAATGRPRLGPYDVTGTLGPTGAGELLVGFDPRLRRRVWLHVAAPGTPPVAAAVRDQLRPLRLRWLAGRRTADEAWDAYEAIEGRPLPALDRPLPWRAVRSWLPDLAAEAEAAADDGTWPGFTFDRVWVTPDGSVRLLDFPAPGLTASPPAGTGSLQPWLASVAALALGGPAGSSEGGRAALPAALPLSAREFLDDLAASRAGATRDVRARAASLTVTPDTVRRGRRAASIAACAFFPIFLGVIGLAAGLALQRVARDTPDLDAMLAALDVLEALPAGDLSRDTLEVYVAGRYRDRLRDESVWTNPLTLTRTSKHRPRAQDLVARHPDVTPDALAAATSALGRFPADQEQTIAAQRRRATAAATVAPVALAAIGLAGAAAFGVVLAVVFRGGLLLRAFGLAVVARHGARVPRWRTGVRAAAAWAPVPVLVYAAFGTLARATAGLSFSSALALLVAGAALFLGGAVYAAWRPEGGLQDAIARTRIVPR